MRVVVPYTNLRAETLASLDASGHPYETFDVSDSDSAYYDVVSSLWHLGYTFVIVEHDVILGPSTLDEIADCPRDWCSYPVSYLGRTHAGLSCAKFSTSFLRAHSDAIDLVAEMSDHKHPPRHWCRLDHFLTRALVPARPHVHTEVLSHVRDHDGSVRPSHGCIDFP